MNTFGQKFRFCTFGESHGKALGVIVDGVPAGVRIDIDFIQSEMDRRKPGKSEVETGRKESDTIEILSGTFEDNSGQLVSTGTSIGMILFNENQKSRDYANVKDLFRPGHADFTYFHKYGIRDYKGGGRSSARETSARVAAGAIAKLMLDELNIKVQSGLIEIAGIKSENIDFDYAKQNILFTLDKNKEEQQLKAIKDAKLKHDSVGGVVLVRASNVPKGLGEPMYHKLDGQIASAMMGLNAVKAVEIGDGIDASRSCGSINNDQITSKGFETNHSGGILGGISNGDDIITKVYFKPTPSIFIEQQTVNTQNEDKTYKLSGRHDPCVAIRGSVVCESMMACILADMVLLNMTSKLDTIKKAYL
ncbi:MAG: chorismate synthase [Epsilonproteobacteria bacterium]|nr:MAG: chorismate synthase [Campylobacterota bacterium]